LRDWYLVVHIKWDVFQAQNCINKAKMANLFN
jgi:hypothetical protein